MGIAWYRQTSWRWALPGSGSETMVLRSYGDDRTNLKKAQ
jgi:hypothetical protein